jgi:hypothetical protein
MKNGKITEMKGKTIFRKVNSGGIKPLGACASTIV